MQVLTHQSLVFNFIVHKSEFKMEGVICLKPCKGDRSRQCCLYHARNQKPLQCSFPTNLHDFTIIIQTTWFSSITFRNKACQSLSLDQLMVNVYIQCNIELRTMPTLLINLILLGSSKRYRVVDLSRHTSCEPEIWYDYPNHENQCQNGIFDDNILCLCH